MANSLILYYSATGTTKTIAEKIAQQLNTDVAEIHPAQSYTDADLNWHDPQSRTSIEQHQHARRVAIQDDLPDINQYDNILIGHPIWWAIPPRLIATTIDHLDLNCKHFASFATSGGTNYDRSQNNIERTIKENNYNVILNQGAVLNNDAQIENWLKTLNLA